MTVSPETTNPDYHIRLTDQDNNSLGLLLCDGNGQLDGRRMGDSIFPRMALQTRQGSSGYEGQELPFVTLDQKNWSGGIGAERFDESATRYLWGEGVDTTRGPIIKGPGVTTQRMNMNTCDVNDVLDYDSAIKSSEIIYFSFTIDDAIDNAILCFPGNYYRYRGLSISLYADDSGEPGTRLHTVTVGSEMGIPVPTNYSQPTSIVPLTIFPYPEEIIFRLIPANLGFNLEMERTYWISVSARSSFAYNYLGLIEDSVNPNLRYYDYDAGCWINSTEYRVPFCIVSESGSFRTIYFEYKKALYKVVMETENSAPKLFINGYRGVAQSNAGALNRLKTNLNLNYGEAIDATIIITNGSGENEMDPYRKVIEMRESEPVSGVCDQFLVDHDWLIEHDTTTEFVIVGTNVWTEITDHGIEKPITDILVVNDIVYFAQGTNHSYVRLMREYQSDGLWMREFKNKNGSYDDLIAVWETDGKAYIYASKRKDCVVQKSEVMDWGSGWSWGSNIQCGYGKITNVIAYGSPRRPYVLKHDEIGYISNDIYQALPLDEFRNMEDPSNGRAVVVGDVYLYFTMMGNHIERFYDGRLDDMGPDRGAGLPRSYQGEITALINYAGRVFAAIDGGIYGKSCIMQYNGYGWCCLYANPHASARLTDLYIQSIPGGIDLLWFHDGAYSGYLPISWNPKQEVENYFYTSQAIVISGWIEADFADLNKYWHSCKVFGEGIGNGNTIKVYYQTENDPQYTWHYAGEMDEDGEEILFSNDASLFSNRLRVKLVIVGYLNGEESYHCQIDTMLIYCVERVSTKRQHQIYFLVDPDAVDLNGQPTSMDEEAIIDQLRTWQDGDKSPLPLTLNSAFEAYDNVKVFLDSLTITRLESEIEPERKNSYLCSATLLRV